jgi:hypothetical protein
VPTEARSNTSTPLHHTATITTKTARTFTNSTRTPSQQCHAFHFFAVKVKRYAFSRVFYTFNYLRASCVILSSDAFDTYALDASKTLNRINTPPASKRFTSAIYSLKNGG